MSTGFQSLNVLLVEDNKSMRAIMSTILNGIGIREIRETSDAQVARKLIEENVFDLALIDFHMEGVNGVELTRYMRRSPKSLNPYVPIIMVTGHSERSRVMEARDAGITEFAAKPVTAKTLLARLEAVIFHPRPFVQCKAYFGPDRRRRTAPGFSGPFRRSSDKAFLIN